MRNKTNGRFEKRYKVNENFFDVIEEKQAWLLGLIAADGCIYKNTFSITQSEKDKGLIESCKNMLSYTGPVYYKKAVGNDKAKFVLTITSRKLIERMSSFGVVKNKSLKFVCPCNLPRDMDSCFLQGYLDGDGCVGVYNVGNSPQYLVISLIATEFFANDLLKICPVAPRLSIHNCKKLWDCRWNGEFAIKFGRWLFQKEINVDSRKRKTFEEYEKKYVYRFEKYTEIRGKLATFLSQGMSMMKATKELGISFQTGYRWMSKGLLDV